jgi:chromosome segregation ATPase
METLDQGTLELKSPLRKLVQVFRRSRNRWKAKYRDLKSAYKLKDNQVRAVEKSRGKWRQDAQQARQQLRQLQRELEEHKKSAPA